MLRERFDRGYFHVGTVRGVPVRLHWSTPVGLFVFTGFRVAPLAWLAFVALLLVHEAGHAVMARRFGHQVRAVELTGFGGLCRWSGVATPYERGLIAWGGVIAQAALFVMTVVAIAVIGQPSWPLREITATFLATNVWLAAINLLPFPPLDGAEAWSVVPEVVARWRSRFARWSRSARAGVRTKASPRSTQRDGNSPSAAPASVAPSARRRASTSPPTAPTDRDLADVLARIAGDASRARSRR